MTQEEEAFVKELARRAKAQNALGTFVATNVGQVSVLPQEKNNLDAVSARENKTATELINQYL